jgi:hypothetical protein
MGAAAVTAAHMEALEALNEAWATECARRTAAHAVHDRSLAPTGICSLLPGYARSYRDMLAPTGICSGLGDYVLVRVDVCVCVCV